jgi:hypothetical protein
MLSRDRRTSALSALRTVFVTDSLDPANVRLVFPVTHVNTVRFTRGGAGQPELQF